MFKYKLQPVLALKEKIEENKKRELGIANGYYEKLENEKLDLIHNKKVAIEAVKKQSNQQINIQMLKQLNYYSSFMDQAIETKKKEAKEAAAKVEEKRNELLEAVKERKILDNLKEIHFENYRDEEKREENRLMDEIVTYRFGAKKKEENR